VDSPPGCQTRQEERQGGTVEQSYLT
jgi:hypothetical protein